MVTEIKPKCYICLNPITPASLADFAGLTCQGSDLDHQSTAHHLYSIINYQHTNNRSQTYTKQIKL